MTHLHPAFRLPPHKFDFFGVKMGAACHCGGAVVLLQTRVELQSAPLKLACHARTRVRCWMLNVRPVAVALCELEIGCYGLAPIIGVADDEPANDQQSMLAQHSDGRQRRIDATVATLTAVFRARL